MTIEVTVNGEDRAVPQGYTTSALLADLGLGEDGIAVAVDNMVHPRSQWDSPLPAGAEIEVLTAVQGG
ncbi:sulfur carrier protein ThiS [Jongsikchunia kroppenstedtii]|uniref:sulfur carrier protein ThiS n=1 Tax=Jongsikchunia kroppenstedtii TaxID=1121721 RepID=UPI0003677DE5